MIAPLLVPLLVPCALPPLARRATARLTPVAALWCLTSTTLVLAVCSLAALGTLTLYGLLALPAFAALGDLIHPLSAAPALLPLAGAATGALAVCAWALLRSAVRQIGEYHAAKETADAQPTTGDLCVIDSPDPDAYALPGSPGRIVVTTAMLRSLNPAEREALFAHERAHLSGRHHYHLAAIGLAAHCHPGLRPARAAVRLAAERAADEAAATATGDRQLTARAIGRAALAGRAARGRRPTVAPAATSGPVPQRVAALLRPPLRRCLVSVASVLLALCACLSLAGAGAGALTLHRTIEIAQGERPSG
ncbi:M48 family metalloprotease [Streptomyces sp. ME19-01-6]|uniref:M48 family metalloprotease n=1 Tax=Streptomyces sp. ME19-01-6 TaxID=3028686 RepID=UPI0029BAF157|nr:M48 family metalloprotease [Streptomyces sp. ME19-01-6]MDX3229017.1 M48 family metalloprotease [Streptomyces sp. ME19-01-6]